jgi:hypothetical protein
VEAALSDAGSGARVASQLASNPAETLKSLQELLEDPRIRAVQEDRLFWSYVQHGAVENALNRGSFWRVVNDEELRGQLADLGLIDEAAAQDPRVFREAVGELLGEVGPRLKGLAEDAELQELARDPEIVAMLESGDTMGLLGHPGVQKIVSRVSSGL